MSKKIIFSFRRICPTIIIFIIVLGVQTGFSATPYYAGKVVTFVVPTSPGGGTDIYARLIAKHLKRHIPGEPNIVIRNMTGAGGLVSANHVWNAKPDGRTCLVTAGRTVMGNVLRPKGTMYKLEEMHPFFSVGTGRIYYSKPGMITKPSDIMTAKGLIFGHGDPTSGVTSGFLWAKELLGFQIEKSMLGYSGGAPAWLAYLSGETNLSGTVTVNYFARKSYVDNGEIVPIFQSGILDENGDVVPSKRLKGILSAPELYEEIYGKKPSGLTWEAYKLVVGFGTYNNAFLLPPKTPSDYVDIFVNAAINMVKDPKFLKDQEKISPGDEYFVGNELVKGYSKGISAAPEVITYMKGVLSQKYGVVFE